MSRTKNALGAALIFAIPGLIIGLLLLLVPTDLLLKLLFVVMGVITVISSIPGLIAGIVAFSTAGGKLSLLVSVVSAVIGFLMVFNHNEFLMIFLGVYMIVLPAVNILIAKDHFGQFKAELPKLVIGILLILLGPANTIDMLFRIAGWVIIALTVVYSAVIFFGMNKKPKVTVSGTRVFVDKNGDGTVDAVFVDTTGDGKADTEVEYRGKE